MARVWRRDQFTTGGAPGAIALIALSPDKLPDPLPVSRKQHGIPEDSEGAGAIVLVTRDRAEDPAWFVDQVVAPFADLIASDLGPDVAATALATSHAYVIEGEIEDPEDLGHVQAAWALAKCLCEQGAALVIDVYAARAHLGTEVAALAPDRELDVMHEVTLFFDETDGGTLAAWSLGLRKFGRPEIVLLDIAADKATEAALLLRDIAATLAAGERIEPGDGVGVPDGRRLVAERFDPATAPVVSIEGDALLLR
ncbi:MAG TPA: hypothetical protein VFQ65_17340 [Kofleriaceae bacterium]|nr:hypothetical protein [Kofleriaceae bacterium]